MGSLHVTLTGTQEFGYSSLPPSLMVGLADSATATQRVETPFLLSSRIEKLS